MRYIDRSRKQLASIFDVLTFYNVNRPIGVIVDPDRAHQV